MPRTKCIPRSFTTSKRASTYGCRGRPVRRATRELPLWPGGHRCPRCRHDGSDCGAGSDGNSIAAGRITHSWRCGMKRVTMLRRWQAAGTDSPRSGWVRGDHLRVYDDPGLSCDDLRAKEQPLTWGNATSRADPVSTLYFTCFLPGVLYWARSAPQPSSRHGCSGPVGPVVSPPDRTRSRAGAADSRRRFPDRTRVARVCLGSVRPGALPIRSESSPARRRGQFRSASDRRGVPRPSPGPASTTLVHTFQYHWSRSAVKIAEHDLGDPIADVLH
jgi:hypothetical protein